MKVWRRLEGEFLNETIRRAGLGNATHKPICCRCLKQLIVEGENAVAGDEQYVTDLFHCESCRPFMECKECCLHRHQRTPLHNIEVSSICTESM